MKSDNNWSKRFRNFMNFRMHLSVFVLVIVSLWLTLVIGGATMLPGWFVYLSAGWGLIVFIHFLVVYRMLRNRRNEKQAENQ
jgi:hypothetical protein